MKEKDENKHMGDDEDEGKFENENVLDALPPPRALLKFFKVVSKGMLEGFKRISRGQLFNIIFVVMLIFGINLYLVVFVNDGFVVRSNRWYNPIMAVQGTKLQVSIFWITAVILIQAILFRVKSFGIFTFFKDQLYTPIWLYKCISMAGESWFVPLLLWGAIALLVSSLIENPFIILVFALMAFFSFNAQLKGGVFYLIYLALIDWNYRFKKARYLNLSLINLGMFGAFVGFLISYFLPFKPYSSLFMGSLIIILLILTKFNIISRTSTATIILLILLNLYLCEFKSILAHDGGFREGGGTLSDWVQSDGAGTAATLGAETSLIGGLTSFIGSILTSGGLNFLQGRTNLPIGSGVVDFVRVATNIVTADNSRDSCLAAADSLTGIFSPTMGDGLSGPMESFMDFATGGDGTGGSDTGSGNTESGNGDRGGSGGRSSSSIDGGDGGVSGESPWDDTSKKD